LAWNRITDAGLAHLKLNNKLRFLSLPGNQIKGPGLANLKGLTRLNDLTLKGNPLTNAALEQLAQLPRLQYVTISPSADLSPSALQNLRKKVLELNIRDD
jgi:hypothetical protein